VVLYKKREEGKKGKPVPGAFIVVFIPWNV
jgi:hypothetical protein